MTRRETDSKRNSDTRPGERSLMLLNDDVNSFEHVIRSLVDVCGHDELQAEQCAVLTHIKGGCVIKIADSATIEEIRMRLRELSLDTVMI